MLERIRGFEMPEFDEDYPALLEETRESLDAIEDRLILLEERLKGEEGDSVFMR